MASSPSPFAFSSMAGVSAKNNNADGASAAPSYPDDATMEKMAAGAFRALCEHLRLRSDLVQNVDLMTVGGFFQNCLAKGRFRFCRDRPAGAVIDFVVFTFQPLPFVFPLDGCHDPSHAPANPHCSGGYSKPGK